MTSAHPESSQGRLGGSGLHLLDWRGFNEGPHPADTCGVNQLSLQPLVDLWQRSSAALGSEGDTWPEAESAELLHSVFEAIRATRSSESEDGAVVRGPRESLSANDRAARSWARVQPTLPVLTSRLGALQQVISADVAEGWPADDIVRVCSVVMATAHEEFTLRLQLAALTDPLTGIGNRRALDNAWRAALAQGRRLGQPVCLVAIDLDGLKRINDFQGHGAGDDAIVNLCAGLRAALRDTDEVFRIGGDEFVALLPGTAAGMADQLIARVLQYNAPRFSWGAADTVQDGSTLDVVLGCADRRLYAQRRRVRPATTLSATTTLLPRRSFWSRVKGRRAVELAVTGVLAVAIGAIVVSISGGNHSLCAEGDGPTVVDCGLSNAVYYCGIALMVAGGILLGVGVIARVLFREID